MHISIAASANQFDVATLDVKTLSDNLDCFNVMTYDYFVSDIASANVTAPNQNLANPPAPLFAWGV